MRSLLNSGPQSALIFVTLDTSAHPSWASVSTAINKNLNTYIHTHWLQWGFHEMAHVWSWTVSAHHSVWHTALGEDEQLLIKKAEVQGGCFDVVTEQARIRTKSPLQLSDRLPCLRAFKTRFNPKDVIMIGWGESQQGHKDIRGVAEDPLPSGIPWPSSSSPAWCDFFWAMHVGSRWISAT